MYGLSLVKGTVSTTQVHPVCQVEAAQENILMACSICLTWRATWAVPVLPTQQHTTPLAPDGVMVNGTGVVMTPLRLPMRAARFAAQVWVSHAPFAGCSATKIGSWAVAAWLFSNHREVVLAIEFATAKNGPKGCGEAVDSKRFHNFLHLLTNLSSLLAPYIMAAAHVLKFLANIYK